MKYSNYVYHIYLSKGKKKNEKKVTFAQYLSAQYFYLPFFLIADFLPLFGKIFEHMKLYSRKQK